MEISQHNSINKKQFKLYYYKPGATRARIYQLDNTKSAETIVSEYRHKIQVCLKKASTNTTQIKKARPPAWEPPINSWSSRISMSKKAPGIFCSWTPASDRSNVYTKQKTGERIAGEYLVYPRDLRPAF